MEFTPFTGAFSIANSAEGQILEDNTIILCYAHGAVRSCNLSIPFMSIVCSLPDIQCFLYIKIMTSKTCLNINVQNNLMLMRKITTKLYQHMYKYVPSNINICTNMYPKTLITTELSYTDDDRQSFQNQ